MTAYENSTFRQQADHEKRMAALSSVAAAVFLTVMKLVVGILTGSLGILSEAAHSGLDLVAAAITYFAVRLSGKPADPHHTYGHGKIENLSALFETVLLLVTCVWIIYEAFQRLFVKSVPVEASLWAFVVMAISIAVDLSRSRLLQRTARKYDSQALEADALHFSTDIWSSSVVIGGLFLVVLADWLRVEWLAKADSVAAVGVAAIVMYVSLQLGKKTIADLLDAVPPGLRDEVAREVQAVSGVDQVARVRIRRSGPETFADVSVTVKRDMSVEQAHEIASAVETAVRRRLPGSDVVVNVAPASRVDEGIFSRVRILGARQGLGVHGMRLVEGKNNRWLELHLEVKDDLTLEQAHAQATAFEDAVRQQIPGIDRIDTHIEPAGEQAGRRTGRPVDETLVLQVLQQLPDVTGIACHPHDVRVHRIAGELTLSFHCIIHGDASILDAHALTEQIEGAIRRRVPDLGRVIIHLEPQGTESPP